MRIISISLLFLLTILGCRSKKALYQSENLIIRPVSGNTFTHETFLNTETWGKVGCNGLIYIKNNEAIVFDTPTDNRTSNELIEWIAKRAKIKAVIINHFHVDCLGGLKAFHEANVPSYANELTLSLAQKDNVITPQHSFKDSLILIIGQTKVINCYFGEAHTKDNIVSYIPSEKTLFGGCMIKSNGAAKGNLADANINEWSKTVQNVKTAFSDVKYVIPGHGNIGGIDLLDYTIQMFKK